MTELTERNPRHYKPKPTMSELSEKELLSMADCSVLLGVTVNTVRRFIHSRRLLSINLGYRTVRIRRCDFDMFLAANNDVG